MFKKIFDRPPGEPLLVFRKRRTRRATASAEPPPTTAPEPEPSLSPPAAPTPKPAYALTVKEPSRFRKFVGWYVKGLLGGVGVIAFLLVVLFLFPSPRMNILVLGLDRRAAEKTFVSRTDTMILATVDPSQPYVGMLSIPRDLYLTLPNGVEGRINTAHFFAEAEAPGTGPAAAMQTVRSNFGVTVNRFVRLDFAGFVKIVDAMGGITIDVPAPVSDNAYPTEDGGTQFISFEAGPQHMDGQRALIYARTRHSSSDFARANRQQLVIQACFNRLLQPGAWVRLPLILAAVNASIDTDVTPLDLLRLAPTLLRVGPAGLDRRVIEGNMVQPNTTPGGGSVQLPVWENINPVLKEMFGE
jgi:LCP family protein required for cell wall assembly